MRPFDISLLHSFFLPHAATDTEYNIFKYDKNKINYNKEK